MANDFSLEFNGPSEPLPGEPFELVSDVSIGASVTSNHSPSYSIEYSADNGRGGIRHLLADTFKINDTRNYTPSPSSSDPYLPNDYYCGRDVSIDQEEFISVDIQPYLASDVSENGSTIKNYTGFWSRPEIWRATDNGSELYEVTDIENVKHFRILPFDEVRMYESVWPGTEVGIATGIIYPNDKRNIYISTGVIFSSQPTGCSGIDWVGFTTTYRGDLVHDNDGGKTATNTVIIPRNTRINSVSSSVFGLNKDHTYVGIGSTVIQFKIRRIGPSGVNREYGYYFRHYDWEDPIHAYDGIIRPNCGVGGGPGYWQGENQHATGDERYALDHQFLSEYSYAFYYGKVPDGYYKKVYDLSDDPTLDLNGNQRYDYNSGGRWGIYIDDEVKNYFEGRILVGHNIGIGTGGANEPEPIVSIFNNKWKNQQDEIDSGAGGNCIGTRVTDPDDFMQFQMGLFVEDIVGIGTRIDKRYRLNVDASEDSAGITATTVTSAAKFVGDVEVVGIVSATGTDVGIISAKNIVTGVITATSAFVGPTISALESDIATAQATADSKKSFDIPHPTKPGYRLRHICLEGPEAGVYVRGRLTGKNVIELPEYWRGLVDPETITVTLTQIKTSQDLIIDNIEWGTRIKVRSGNGTDIDCFYTIQAERKDGEKLIAEYEGLSIEDYPGDNSQYTCNK